MSDALHKPVILTYHSISAGSSPLKISPSLFAEQMEWLGRNTSVISLAVLVEALRKRLPLPSRAVVLTFDDGFADFYSHAVPVLLRLNLPAIVFLPTQYMGRANSWPGQPGWVEEQPLMNWDQVRELSEKGIQFGAHSWSHADLTGASALSEEILASKRDLQTQVGREPLFFCYPYGRWNPTVRESVSHHYQAACSTFAAAVSSTSDIYALPRVDAHYLRSPRVFRSLFTSRLAAYIALRRFVRRVRGQPEGTYGRS